MEKRIRAPECGFSLIELLVTLAIVSIVLAIGGVDMSGLLKRTRIDAAAGEFAASVRLARSEAVKRADAVTICATGGSNACIDSTDWSNGWMVANADGERLQVQQSMAGKIEITAPVSSVRFLDTGFQDGSVMEFQLVGTACEGSQGARRITLDRIGHYHVESIACPSA